MLDFCIPNIVTAFGDFHKKSLLLRFSELVQMGQFEDSPQLSVVVTVERVQIRTKCPAEQDWVLWDNGQPRAKVVQA